MLLFVLLVVLYNTTKGTHGSTLAAPVSSSILEKVLPYLGVTSDDANIKSSDNQIAIPNITNKTVTEAEKILKNAGLNVYTSFKGNKNSTLVSTQVPTAKTILPKDSVVILYTENNSTRTSIEVPNLKGMTLSKARSTLKKLHLNIIYSGNGVISNQTEKAGSTVEEGSIIHVKLSN